MAEQHYSALKAYTFFLHWIIIQAEQQAKEAAKSAPATAPAAKGRSKAKKATQLDSQWDWDANKDKIAKTLAKLSEVDFWQLCHANTPEEAFLVRWTQAVSSNAYCTDTSAAGTLHYTDARLHDH